MTPVIGDLIESTVGKIVGKLADKYLPASMSEKEKSDAALAIQKELADEFKSFTELVKTTEPDAAATPRWINGLRASVRPGIAWLSFLTYQGMMVWLTWENKMSVTEFVAQAGALSTMAIGFYFGTRHNEKP